MEQYTRSKIADINPDAIILDGFDDAIIGISECGKVIYRIDTMMKVLVAEHDMTDGEALEYLDFNVLCAHFGDYSPIYLIDL